VSSRIKSTQQNVQQLLKQRPEYVVTTSDFVEVKRYLEQSLNRRKGAPEVTGPTLRKLPSDGRIEKRDDQRPDDTDERPTLKRRNLTPVRDCLPVVTPQAIACAR
jgi:hypothetical protein